MNKEKFETGQWLHDQLHKGFNPKWFISYHYHHPSENLKPVKETRKPFGHGERIGFRTYGEIWNQVESYNQIQKKRVSYDSLEKDTRHIRNLILKYLYGIARPNRIWSIRPELMFFHEKGKTKLQYHTHLLLSGDNCIMNTEEEILEVFTSSIRRRAKCMSKWKDVHVRSVDDPSKAISYLNKETNLSHNSLDYKNSIFTQDNPWKELLKSQ